MRDLKAIERGKKLKVDPSLTRGKPFNCFRYRKTIRGFKEPSRRFKEPSLFKYWSLFKSHTLLRLFLKISKRPGPGSQGFAPRKTAEGSNYYEKKISSRPRANVMLRGHRALLWSSASIALSYKRKICSELPFAICPT